MTNANNQASGSKVLITLIDAPLYKVVRVEGDSQSLLKDLRLHTDTFDMYCPECKAVATWESVPTMEALELKKVASLVPVSGHIGGRRIHWNGRFMLFAKCTRRGHPLTIYADSDVSDQGELALIKIGQLPSMSDIQMGDLKELGDAMPKELRKEFVQAISTTAHGYPVAAFVYYRRVFERVMDKAKAAHMEAAGIDEWPEYGEAKTPKRITLLADQLPQFMVDNAGLYGILSEGVHQLTEEQCADALPLLRESIEMILVEQHEKTERAKRQRNLSGLIAQFGNALNNPKSG